MPFVNISIQEGKTGAYKRALLHGVRRALVSAVEAADTSIMQRISEYDSEDLDIPESKSDRLTIIEISMLPRDAEAKRDLYREILRSLSLSPGISAEDVMIVVNEPHRECFGICGVVPAAPAPRGAGDSSATAPEGPPVQAPGNE